MEDSHRIRALLWADVLVRLSFFLMQNYLTDIWNLNFIHAAAILNIWGGISMILPVFFLFLIDTVLGNFTMLVISSISYTLGISFVAMSTPAVFASNSCKEYGTECIGDIQRALFYIGMALIASAIAGYEVSLRPFLQEQKHVHDDENANEELDKKFVEDIHVLNVFIIGAIAHPFIKSWSLAFGIAAVCTAIATILFLSGSSGYRRVESQGWSPLTRVSRVLVAAALNKSTLTPPQLYKKNERESFFDTRFLRCLEKAAIKLPYASEEDQLKKWRLCSVAEVEDAKVAVRMVPIWLTFIVYGIVSSVRYTYFIEQSNHMYRKLGSWEVSMEAILMLGGWCQEMSTLMSEYIYYDVYKKEEERPSRGLPLWLIGGGMCYMVLSCVTASKVEIRRLKVITSHGLLDKPSENIPMNVAWLLPQFLLLFGADVAIKAGVRVFCNNESPESMTKYQPCFMNGMSGLGFISGVWLVNVVGKVTDWFQLTLNRSRLDSRFYWLLAGFSGLDIVLFIVVASCYRFNKREEVADEEGVDTCGRSASVPSRGDEIDSINH